jgi:hypothetical protein
LITLAIVVLAPVLLLAAYIAWGLWANERAEREARAMCASIKVGDTRSRVQELAKGEHEPGNFFPIDDKGYKLIYYGMIFHASECRVMISADRVVSKEIIRYDD